MQSLTNVERMLKTINRQEPDMIPTFEEVIEQRVIDAIKPGLSYDDFCEYMDLDAVCYYEQQGWKYEMIDEAKGIARDEWGSIQRFTGASSSLPLLVEPAIKSEKDLDTYVSPDPDLPFRYKHIEQAVKRFKGKRAIIASVSPPFRTVKLSLRGEVDWYKDMIRNPDFVDRLNQIALDYHMKYVKNCIDIGVDIIWPAGDFATNQGPMVSPKFTERFILSGIKEMIQYSHSKGIPCLVHTDGNIWLIFDLILETGVDAIDPLDPVAGMDLGEAKAKYGGKVCLMGNVDCGNLLSWGTKDEVHEAVKECIRKAGKGGGYICKSSNSIHNAVNPENYVEMIKAIREYGKYPLEDHFDNLVIPGSRS